MINLKTAKALGVTIPQTLLLRADEVIQLAARYRLPAPYWFRESVEAGRLSSYATDFENIPTSTPQAMTEWYGTRAVLSGWSFREQDYDDFRQTFTGKLRLDQIETLIRWHKEEIMPEQGGR